MKERRQGGGAKYRIAPLYSECPRLCRVERERRGKEREEGGGSVGELKAFQFGREGEKDFSPCATKMSFFL